MQKRLGVAVIRFCDFKSNPTYESVVDGVKKFKMARTGLIIAVGGGSAMDVAKCIKLYSNMDESKNFLHQEIFPNNTKFFAVPTTAGTGSEATKYAVVYYRGEKQSITHESCVPELVLMDSSVLNSLPIYQKKSTMLDAFCHAIEAFWSVNSTGESKEYSKEAMKMIIDNMGDYLSGKDLANEKMMRAAYLAGKAINITQTTAGHAMCYKLTGLYGIAHGHAAALCVRILWIWMVKNLDKCVDYRGETYLKEVFDELSALFNCKDSISAGEKFFTIFHGLELEVPRAKETDYNILVSSVNPDRLKNNPINLSRTDINILYHEILKG